MALVDRRPPATPLPIRPLVAVASTTAASALFVIGLAIAARSTRDRPVVITTSIDDAGALPGLRDDRDAGPRGTRDSIDAGADARVDERSAARVEDGDSLEAAGPLQEPDAGPVDVKPAPIDVDATAQELAALVQRCTVEALRWDPSLGGPFVVRWTTRGGTPTLTLRGLASPVLDACLQRVRGALPTSSLDLVLEAHAVLDGVQARVTLERATLVDVAAIDGNGE